MAKRLAIVTSHPIQYNAPWFRLLATQRNVAVKVFYTWEQSQQNEKYDPGFDRVISWDIPLLDGYEYTFVKNIAADPGSHHYKGLDNPTLNSEIENWKADAVLVFGWPFKSHLRCLKYFKGKITVLFRGDSTLLDEQGGVKQIIRRLLLKYIYRHVDHALYVGTNNKLYFQAHGLKEDQLHLLPHAIDNDRFGSNDEEYNAAALQWRQQLGISEDNFVILFAGKLEAKKDPQFILKLAEKMTGTQYRFIIVGNGPLEQQVKEAASKDARIICIDFQNQQQMPVVYRLADVFVLPSIGPGETWGLALNEAMACGKPVIATNKTGGAIDLINGNGIVITPGDVNAAAGYIESLVSNQDAYQLASSLSKEMVSRFSFNSIVNNIQTLLKRI